MRKNFYMNKNTKKTMKGEIADYQVSDLIKNDWVGANNRDYYFHTLKIKDGDEVQTFKVCFLNDEPRFEIGDYVSFRYTFDKELKENKIEAKSLGKSLSPKELAEINKNIG